MLDESGVYLVRSRTPDRDARLIGIAPVWTERDAKRCLMFKIPTDGYDRDVVMVFDACLVGSEDDEVIHVTGEGGQVVTFEPLTVDLLKRHFPDEAARPGVLSPDTTDAWLRRWYYENNVDEAIWPLPVE